MTLDGAGGVRLTRSSREGREHPATHRGSLRKTTQGPSVCWLWGLQDGADGRNRQGIHTRPEQAVCRAVQGTARCRTGWWVLASWGPGKAGRDRPHTSGAQSSPWRGALGCPAIPPVLENQHLPRQCCGAELLGLRVHVSTRPSTATARGEAGLQRVTCTPRPRLRYRSSQEEEATPGP